MAERLSLDRVNRELYNVNNLLSARFMDILYIESNGKSYYIATRRSNSVIFTGSLKQCKDVIDIMQSILSGK